MPSATIRSSFCLVLLLTGGGAAAQEAPFPGCGNDRSPDALDCESYDECP